MAKAAAAKTAPSKQPATNTIPFKPGVNAKPNAPKKPLGLDVSSVRFLKNVNVEGYFDQIRISQRKDFEMKLVGSMLWMRRTIGPKQFVVVTPITNCVDVQLIDPAQSPF